MPRRSQCLGNHDWKMKARHGKEWYECSKCPVVFPCRERCAHTDCEAVTKVIAKCHVCHKTVPFEDGFHYTIGRPGKLVRVHFGCRTTALDREQVVSGSEEANAPVVEPVPGEEIGDSAPAVGVKTTDAG
jgi:hypothetical protein